MKTLTLTIVALAAMVFVMSGTGCTDGTTPPDEDDNDNSDPGAGVTYSFGSFDLTRFSTNLRDVWRTWHTYIMVGEGGMVLNRSTEGVYVLPTGVDNDLNDAWGIGDVYPDTLFIVGDGDGTNPGVILRYFNKSKRRLLMEHPIEGDVTAIYGTGWENVYATGSDGRLIRFDGDTWTPMFRHPAGTAFTGVWANEQGEIWVVGEEGAAFQYDGTSWTNRTYEQGFDFTSLSGLAADRQYTTVINEVMVMIPLGYVQFRDPAGRHFNDVDAYDIDWVVAVGDDGVSAKKLPVGFEALDMGSNKDFMGVVRAGTPNTALAVGDSGSMYHLSESEWRPLMDSQVENWQDIHGVAPNICYGVMGGKLMRYIVNEGWVEEASIVNIELQSIYCLGEDQVHVIGTRWETDKYSYYYDGTDWSTGLYLGHNATFPRDMWFEDINSGCIVGEYGGAWYLYYYSQSQEYRWQPRLTNTSESLHGVWGHSSRAVFAVGTNGAILNSDDGGRYWSSMTSPTTEHLNDVWGWASNQAVAVGDNGTVIIYNGGAWQVMTPSPDISEDLHSVWAGDGNAIWAAGTGDKVIRYDGASWRYYNTGLSNVPVRKVWGTSANSVFFACDDDFVLWYNR